MIVSILVAVDENNAIGKDNQLLWHLPIDLKRFKQLTSRHTVIMGRKTFDSIGKLLPNRKNIVVTRQENLTIPGCQIAHSLAKGLDFCKNDQQVFIIGGAEIYRQAIALCDTIFLTRVYHTFEADTYFPVIDFTDWIETQREEHLSDQKHAFAFSFITYVRKHAK